jgi:hypothetical protein
MTPTPGTSSPESSLEEAASPPDLSDRARGRRRLGRVFFVGALLVPAFLQAWRVWSMAVLPDPGDPFDLATLRAPELPDDRNAVMLYRVARDHLRPLGMPAPAPVWLPGRGGPPASSAARRPQTPPDVGQWVEANREAIDLWVSATECPDSAEIEPTEGEPNPGQETLRVLREFAQLARLEAGRLEAKGDMAGALRMHEGVLRSSRHASLQDTLTGRLASVSLHAEAADSLEAWARDPRTDAALLRRALKDALGFAEDRVPLSRPFRRAYRRAMDVLADPERVANAVEDKSAREGGDDGPDTFSHSFWSWFLNEPERTRRVYRLWAANWLAYCDLPHHRRPALRDKGGLAQFLPGADQVPGAHRLAPLALQRAYREALLARVILPPAGRVLAASDKQVRRHDALVVTLAEQLYRREHGALPKTLGDLIGPDLPALPESYAATDLPLTAATTAREDTP